MMPGGLGMLYREGSWEMIFIAYHASHVLTTVIQMLLYLLPA